MKNKERVVKVVAHELAHQWFGNLVTMDWWTDLWYVIDWLLITERLTGIFKNEISFAG